MYELQKGGHKKAVEISVYMLDTEELQEYEVYWAVDLCDAYGVQFG